MRDPKAFLSCLLSPQMVSRSGSPDVKAGAHMPFGSPTSTGGGGLGSPPSHRAHKGALLSASMAASLAPLLGRVAGTLTPAEGLALAPLLAFWAASLPEVGGSVVCP